MIEDGAVTTSGIKRTPCRTWVVPEVVTSPTALNAPVTNACRVLNVALAHELKSELTSRSRGKLAT